MLRPILILLAVLHAGPAMSEVPVYSSLDSLPGLLMPAQHFVNPPDDQGNSKGLEFSSAIEFQGNLIVSDDENDVVRIDPLGNSDKPGYCLFRMVPAPGWGNFTVARPYREAFDGVLANGGNFDDMECTTARGNTLYIMGSHSFNSSGQRRPARENIIRLRATPDGRAMADIRPTGLRERLVSLLAGLPGMTLNAAQVEALLNVEGMTVDPKSGDILLGVKSPLIGAEEKAAVLRVSGVEEYFEGRTGELRVRLETLLDCNRSGISSIEYDPAQGGFLIAASFKEKMDDYAGSSLWLWSGGNARPREICRFRQLALEGVCRITTGPFEGNLFLAFDQETYSSDFAIRHGGSAAVVRWGRKR